MGDEGGRERKIVFVCSTTVILGTCVVLSHVLVVRTQDYMPGLGLNLLNVVRTWVVDMGYNEVQEINI